MTQIYDESGKLTPVTVIEAGPCPIVAIKDRNIQIGFDEVKEKYLTKPVLGIYKKAGVTPRRMLKEVPRLSGQEYTLGGELKVDMFTFGEKVDVIGVSIGKGFQGGMKRWHWRGGGATHGSMHHRRVGSIGASADPSRTLPGSHMPGHMGAQPATVQSLRVMNVDVEHNTILVKGAVPGTSIAYLVINPPENQAFLAGWLGHFAAWPRISEISFPSGIKIETRSIIN